MRTTETTTTQTTTSADIRGANPLERPTADGEVITREEKQEVEMDIRPLQMLRSRMFYCIWVLFLLGGLGGVFLISQYKVWSGSSFAAQSVECSGRAVQVMECSWPKVRRVSGLVIQGWECSWWYKKRNVSGLIIQDMVCS